jgi:GNAT superfamily N-acetyltransferase
VVHIERLAAQHRREGFNCGEPALDDFLLQQAGQLERRGFGKTYVVVEDQNTQVIGFVTLSAGQVEASHLPTNLKLPRYPVPVLRIGRLAVDKTQQGRGTGKHLMSFALHLALEFSERVGLYAVLLDAKNEKAKAFYETLGFTATLDNPMCLYLPIAILKNINKPT